MTPLPPLLLRGDCLVELQRIPDESVDAIVTDPPYGLDFMGKDWDNAVKLANGMLGQISTSGERNPGGGALRKGGTHSQGYANHDGLAFEAWTEQWARECLRILKPGGHLLAFGGSRTWHRLAAGIEDAGFEIRDSIAWLYGSGFPKSLDVSKAIDKAKPVEDVETVRAFLFAEWKRSGVASRVIDDAFGFRGNMSGPHWFYRTSQNAVPTAEQWPILLDLLGVAEVPEEVRRACERVLSSKGLPGPAWFAREVTGMHSARIVLGNSGPTKGGEGQERRDVAHTPEAKQWQGWGTALKPAFEPIVVARKPLVGTVAANVLAYGTGALNIDDCRVQTFSDGPGSTPKATDGGKRSAMAGDMDRVDYDGSKGRWPANVILDESQAAALDEQSGTTKSTKSKPRGSAKPGNGWGMTATGSEYADAGGASRFFYVAKAPKSERPNVDGVAHPTVKPLALMRWLVRLVTPPGGVIVDLFAGSGTTLEAAYLEGFESIGVELTPEYWPLIEARIARAVERGGDR